MATQRTKKGARKARKMKDFPTRSAANVKGGTKRGTRASGRRRGRQLQYDAIAMNPTQSVNEHSQRQLPTVLPLQGGQRFIETHLVFNDVPPAVLPLTEHAAAAHVTRGETYPSSGTYPLDLAGPLRGDNIQLVP
jgi:hypothetical protein